MRFILLTAFLNGLGCVAADDARLPEVPRPEFAGKTIVEESKDKSLIVRTFDTNGLVMLKILRHADGNSMEWRYCYDQHKRLSRLINPDGSTIHYHYQTDESRKPSKIRITGANCEEQPIQ